MVAAKILPAHAANDPQFRERFEREGRVVSSLNHPQHLQIGCDESATSQRLVPVKR